MYEGKILVFNQNEIIVLLTPFVSPHHNKVFKVNFSVKLINYANHLSDINHLCLNFCDIFQ